MWSYQGSGRPARPGGSEPCYAITEEGAGSDVDAIKATATHDGDGYRLNGVKWHVTSFNHADHGERLMIAARGLGAPSG